MGDNREKNILDKARSRQQSKECKIGDYTLSVDEPSTSDGQHIPAIKATHRNRSSVSVCIDPSSKSSLESFRVLTSDNGEFIFKIDQSGNLSFESNAGSLLPDDVLCAAVQKLVTEKK